MKAPAEKVFPANNRSLQFEGDGMEDELDICLKDIVLSLEKLVRIQWTANQPYSPTTTQINRRIRKRLKSLGNSIRQNVTGLL
jgi:hypothetical protein